MSKEFSVKFPELDEFLVCLAKNISSAMTRNQINKEYFNTKNNVAHKSICKIIGNTSNEMSYWPKENNWFRFKEPRCFMPEIRLCTNLDHFVPDFKLYRDGDMFFLVEYESTNSSDARVIGDIYHHGRAVNGEESGILPKYWLIIYTLPEEPVSDWPEWDYLRTNPAFKDVTRKPYEYYKRAFRKPSYLSGAKTPRLRSDIAEYPGIGKYTESKKWNNCKIFLVNLTVKGLEIDFPERFNRKYHFQATTPLPCSASAIGRRYVTMRLLNLSLKIRTYVVREGCNYEG